jgi:hypothetical protein
MKKKLPQIILAQTIFGGRFAKVFFKNPAVPHLSKLKITEYLQNTRNC